MRIFKIDQIRRYTIPAKNKQTLHHSWITFYSRGFEQLNYFSPSGELIFNGTISQPLLMLGSPGSVIDFKAGTERENWVIIFSEHTKFNIGNNLKDIELHYENSVLTLPSIIPVASIHHEFWRQKFIFLEELWKKPLPINRFHAECGVVDIFFNLLNACSKSKLPDKSPEGKLKQLIDDDQCLQYNLSELSEQCGYSSDYLRLLFQKRYQISPMAYRKKQQMTYAMDLIATSQLSIKDIALKIGFHYVSHFCTAFKAEYKLTPVQAIKLYRYI